ncbi:MAG: hypothetical protein M1821_003471 [Bathelium mastoideum]|nr:MAG: hypothetical protein M1821_003471 [Bathelium mastoideum]
MTAPPANRKSSRWGSLLSGAVAGLESRLDTILAEDPDASARSRAAEKAAAEKIAAERAAGDKIAAARTGRPSAISETDGTSSLAVSQRDASRSASRSRANDRLQERLAKALNKDTDSLKSPRASQDIARIATPPIDASAKKSLEIPESQLEPTLTQETSRDTRPGDDHRISGDDTRTEDGVPGAQEQKPTLLTSRLPINPSRNSVDSLSTRPSLDAPTTSSIDVTVLEPSEATSSLTESQLNGVKGATSISYQMSDDLLSHRTLAEHEAELEKLRTEHREELNAHLERIDALQSKLTYLARSTATTAQNAVQSASSGSPEQKIAERDEKIAQLLEEGTKLSATEIKHLGIIKKLRSRVSEEDKAKDNLTKRLSKAESAFQEATERASRTEAELKVMGERMKRVSKLEGEVEALRAERDGHGTTMLKLQSQLEESRQQAEEAEKKVQSGAVEAKKRAADDLAEQLENARIEKKLLEERLRTEIRQAEESTKRKEEQAKISDMELKAEIANLESKIELLRTRTEEASSDPAGESQAKLLRQIETLQTQYALASENWQGIESTLTARLATLEKERDDAAKRESDVRRKARDIGVKSRTLEEDLEAANSQRHALEEDLESLRPQLHKLQERSKEVETAFTNMKADFERERQVWENEQSRKIQEERARWQLELQAAQQNAFVDQQRSVRNHDGTSTFGSRKSSTPDLANLYSRRAQNSSRNNLSSSELSIQGFLERDRPSSSARRPLSARTPSFGTPISPSPGTPHRQDSSSSLQPQPNGLYPHHYGNGLNISTQSGSSSPIPPTPPTAIPTSSLMPLSALAQAGTPSLPPSTTSAHTTHDTDLLDASASSSPTRRSRSSSITAAADMLVSASASAAPTTTAASTGPSVQLVERMSGAVRRLEAEKAALREELGRLGAQRDEARREVVALMGEVEARDELDKRVQVLEGEKAGVEERYGAALEMLGEKSELVDELRADVEDLKKIYRELVERTVKD